MRPIIIRFGASFLVSYLLFYMGSLHYCPQLGRVPPAFFNETLYFVVFIAAFFTLSLYLASAIFFIGSMAGYLIHYEILLDQAPYFTMKAGMVCTLIAGVAFVAGILAQVIYCYLRSRKRK